MGNKKEIILNGYVFSGLGKGSFFVSLDEYKNFFSSLLGGDPYPGTLNVKLDNASWRDLNWHYFKPENGFGAIYYRVGRLGKEKIIVIRPARSRHEDDVIEIVSSINLRKKYGLEDGDKISLEVFLSD